MPGYKKKYTGRRKRRSFRKRSYRSRGPANKTSVVPMYAKVGMADSILICLSDNYVGALSTTAGGLY
jgi:hypothetical protein